MWSLSSLFFARNMAQRQKDAVKCQDRSFPDFLCVIPLSQEAAQYRAKGGSRKMHPFIVFVLMGSFARTPFSRTLPCRPILCHSGHILHSKVFEHLVWSNTSGFQFWGPLARTNIWSALRGLPTQPLDFIPSFCVGECP